MKKIIAVLLSLILIICLCSCNKPQEGLSQNGSNSSTSQQSKPTPEPEEMKDINIKLSFTGDMILAQYAGCPHADAFDYYAKNQPPTYFLEKVRSYFTEDDFTVVNLENVLSDRSLTPITKNYSPAFWFKSKTSNIEILSSSGVEAVMINNNHIRDYGQDGYNDTVAAIEGAGLQYGNDGKIIYLEKQGFKISVICVAIWGRSNTQNALNRLAEASAQSDYQIIFFHGGTEKIHAPEQWKINAARALIDNGADLVVGSHPHVLQPRETYNGHEIVYSLGNFCYGGARKPENRTVIYQVELTVDLEKQVKDFNSELIPCYVYTGSANNFQPAPIEEGPIKQKVLDFMEGKCSSPV